MARPEQPAQPKVANTVAANAPSLKAKYLDVIQSQVVEPLKRDLASQGKDSGGVEKALEKELERAKKLHLSDLAG